MGAFVNKQHFRVEKDEQKQRFGPSCAGLRPFRSPFLRACRFQKQTCHGDDDKLGACCAGDPVLSRGNQTGDDAQAHPHNGQEFGIRRRICFCLVGECPQTVGGDARPGRQRRGRTSESPCRHEHGKNMEGNMEVSVQTRHGAKLLHARYLRDPP